MATKRPFNGLTTMTVRDEIKLVWVRFKDNVSRARVARIHALTRQNLIPEEILEEQIPTSNLFKNRATGERFLLKHGKLIQL